MKWGLNVPLKYLTPSSALRDSRLRSPLCISASSTSLFFSAGPRFPASSTVRSRQSSISSTYLNQEVGPINNVGFFSTCSGPLICWFCTINTTIDSTGLFVFSSENVEKSSKSSSWSLIISIVETLNNTHLKEPCTRQDPLLLVTISAPSPLCGCYFVLSV